MKSNMLLLTILSSFFISCSDPVRETENENTLPPVEASPINGIRIAWDYDSAIQLAERGGYPRLLRLQDNTLAAVYESFDGNCVLKRSNDDGATWSSPVILFNKFTYQNENNSVTVNMANPEIYQLENGDILTGCNYRPAKDGIAPFSIAVRRSTDNGRTWKDIQLLYEADLYFHNGCWEPSFLQLPNGEVQVYFANESPYRESDEQEISLLTSVDNGVTWTTEPRQVSFRKDRRDGMPVARLFGDEIVTIIEDNYIQQFKPYTVRTKIADNWCTPILQDSPNRLYALSRKMDDNIYMGAPYLLKLPTGEAVISYQTNENRTNNWEDSVMEIAIGDKEAKNFTNRSRPFQVPAGKEGMWNSLEIWDENTIAAVSASNYQSEHVAPWIIKGYIIPEITIKSSSINNYPLFIGSQGKSSVNAGIGNDRDKVYVTCEVKDPLLYKGTTTQTTDGIYLYIDALNASLGKPYKGLVKIWSDYEGNVSVWEGKNNRWEASDIRTIQVKASRTEKGYTLGFTIPKDIFPEFNKKEFRLGLSLSAHENGYTGYLEHLPHMNPEASNTWLLITYEN